MPLRSSVFRGKVGEAILAGRSAEEVAPAASVALASGHALYNAISSALAGTCH